MVLIGNIIQVLVSVYTLVLLARMILDWVQFFSQDWRPQGLILLVANVVYALTDPPLRWLRKRIPPLRLGAIALDVGFIVLFVGVIFIGNLAKYLF
ncbi:YggT family protein [Gleimia hominis]|uniref:YggT family protein n=1 Tax=Gleimia hominis TaxID=595468 RepID=A0ABU3ICJ4_9ACTO|nr:YggT family protein [Gleimia hominis]MDT3768101.1 YggT family protein [Gleimia hominis]WIK65231.1 YggT family protein [Gleimia hominis]